LWRVVIASWSRWWEKRHYELKVRPVGDSKVIFFLASEGARPYTTSNKTNLTRAFIDPTAMYSQAQCAHAQAELIQLLDYKLKISSPTQDL
jgi:hypothetical protein